MRMAPPSTSANRHDQALAPQRAILTRHPFLLVTRRFGISQLAKESLSILMPTTDEVPTDYPCTGRPKHHTASQVTSPPEIKS